MDDNQYPLISKQLLVFLREVYTTRRILEATNGCKTVEVAYGFIDGVENVIEKLEAIYKLQQGDLDG